MKTALLATFTAMALAGCAAMEPSGSPNEVKIAFDITDGNPQALIAKLTVIDLTRKQLVASGVTPRMVLAFRGDASYYTQTNLSMIKDTDRADALKIAAALRELRKASGVEAIEQCNVPLASRKLKPEDVMQEVKLVPNGWISLAAYQQKGYAYIAP
jgi:intracellular sulfur oxidation DsrE/DsrF family protein